MVNVPVEDTDTLKVEGGFKCDLSCEGCIVEEAEPTCDIVIGVMARRSNDAVTLFMSCVVSIEYFPDCGHCRSCTDKGSLVGILALIDLTLARVASTGAFPLSELLARGLDQVYQVWRMDFGEQGLYFLKALHLKLVHLGKVARLFKVLVNPDHSIGDLWVYVDLLG